jgi:hypothetical protein
MKLPCHLAALVVAPLFLLAAPALAASFQFTTLAYPGATATNLYAINAHDQIVGSEVTQGAEEGMYWSNGTFTAVPNTSYFAAINDSGLIAGRYGTTQSQYLSYAISTGTLTTNNISLPGYVGIGGIDAAGDFEGFAYAFVKRRTYDFTPFIVAADGTLQTLLPPKPTQASAVVANQSGAVVVGVNKSRAYVFQGAKHKEFSIAGASSVTPYVMSSSGIVGGHAFITGERIIEGFTAKGKTVTSITYPGSINTQVTGFGPAGQIVGYYYDNHDYSHGFVLYKGVYTTVEPPSGSYGLVVNGISAKGSIFGNYLTDGATTSFIATCASKVCTK